jgi:outer membrane protein assembly factor BamA
LKCQVFQSTVMRVIIFLFVTICFSLPRTADCQKNAQSDTVKVNYKPGFKRDTTGGRFLTVSRVFITGNRITRDKIISRELSLKSGDIIYEEDLTPILEGDKRKLLNTRLFNTVDIKLLELQQGKVDLIVDVNERWYTFPAPIFEIADRNFNEWWQNYDHDLRRTNYGLRMYQYNMRGRNETLRFHAQFGFQRRVELMYRIPYVDLKQKQGLTLDLVFSETKNVAFRTFDHKYEFLRSQNILRVTRLAGLSYTYRNSFYQTHLLRLEYFNAGVSDTIRSLNPDYIEGENNKQEYPTISYTFNSDHRDLIAYPLRGHQLVFQATKNGLVPSDDLKKIEGTLSYSKYIDLNKGFYLSNNFVGYASSPESLPYTNYGTLGLKRQFVRGYEIYVIEGPFFAMNKTTFKKMIFSRNYQWSSMPIEQFRHIPLSIYLKTYADFAYVKNYDEYEARGLNTRLSNKLLSGTGLGVDVVGFYDLVFRFEYTFNAEGENGFFFHIKREF